MTDITTKQCRNCLQHFPATPAFFHRKKNGLTLLCKACNCAITKARRKADPEHHKGQQAQWRKNNPDKVKAYCKRANLKRRDRVNAERRLRYATDEAYRDECKKQSHDWALQNQERVRENHRQWFKRNKARRNTLMKRHVDKYRIRYRIKWRAYSSKRRALEKSADGKFTSRDIEVLMHNQKHLCWWCGKSLDRGYHIDHRIPLSRGGSNWPANLVLACPSCNESKNNKLPHEWGDRLL